jgi:adenylate cyclase
MSVIDWFGDATLRLPAFRPVPKPDAEPAECPAEPCPAEIWSQVERICAGPEFASSVRLTRFLRFITAEALAGRSDRLKAYTIALAVFERPESFDPQTDPIVRIEAGRLRRMLEHYYLTSGRQDPIHVTVPKGAYAPCFEWRSGMPGAQPTPDTAAQVPPEPAPRAGRRGLVFVAAALLLAVATGLIGSRLGGDTDAAGAPVVLVLPFAADPRDETGSLVASGVSDELIDQLAGFGELKVLGRETSRWAAKDYDPDRMRGEFGVRFVVEGNVRLHGDRIGITARLVETKSGAVVWLDHYDDRSTADVAGLQARVAHDLATKIGQPYGLIFRTESGRLDERSALDWDAYRCTLQYYDYRIALTQASHAAARTCLERTVARFPAFSTGWGMLSMVYLDEDRGGFPAGATAQGIPGALLAGRRAVSADPRNVRALQALSTALYFSGMPGEGREIGEKALALNPNDPDLLGELGARISQAGDLERGRALLEKALALNPGNAGYYMGHLAVASFLQGRREEAVREVEASNLARYPLYHLVAAMVYADANRLDEARKAAAELLRVRPDFPARFSEEMAKRNFRPADMDHIRNALAAAGIAVSGARSG